METRKNKKSLAGIYFGTALIIGGIIYLLGLIGIIDEDLLGVIISPPAGFLIIGIYILIRREIGWGLLVTAFSALFLAAKISKVYPHLINLPYENLSFENILLPLAVIMGGVFVVSESLSKKRWKSWRENKNLAFGSQKNIHLSPILEDTELNIVFGENKLDLRKTDIIDGETRLDANIVFGELKVYVPSHWNLKVDASNLFGSVKDKRIYMEESKDSEKTFIINGSVVLGSIEIKN